MEQTERGPGAGAHKRVSAVVAGRVQGVGFRYWTRNQARRLGLAGSAVNRADGSVEITLEGPGAAVDELLALLESGHAPGRVDRVDVTGPAASGGLSGFDVG